MRSAAVLAVLVGIFGCQATLTSGLDESQANEIVVALDHAGIAADKVPARGPAGQWDVAVAESDVATALDVLARAELPRPREAGVEELFDGSSLVPSAAEERTRQSAAVAGELARSLEAVDGIVDARVHLALPEPTRFQLDEVPPARASVLLRCQGEPPLSDGEVARLVAGAVPDLQPGEVDVLTTRVRVARSPEPELSWIGPIAVSRSTSGTLKAILGGSFGLNALLAVALVYVVVRRRRAGAQRLAPEEARRAEA